MKVRKFLLGAVSVGVISVFYNWTVFSLFDFYPEAVFEVFGDFYEFSSILNFYILIFVKNFIIGFLLMILFYFAYKNISMDRGGVKNTFMGIFFFVLYGILALLAFTLGDMLLMKTGEGMVILFTFDGVVESFIATLPVRFFALKDF